MPARLHPDQVDVTTDQVRSLVAARFPAWRGLPVRPAAAHGTENVLFRVGDDVVVRIPLVPSPGGRSAALAAQDHARFVARRVTVQVPEPLGVGDPGEGYPGVWSAYRWIDGRPAAAPVADVAFARDLATFVLEMHRIDIGDRAWDGTGRGGPLEAHDVDVRAALRASGPIVDTDVLARLWDDCLLAGRGDTPDVWLHADLMPGNLLVRNGRLAAVLDLGSGDIGDPAVDLMPAWNLFQDPAAREAWRSELDVDDDTWRRGRGWALMQAVCALPYYLQTFPSMAATARRTLTQLVAEAVPGDART